MSDKTISVTLRIDGAGSVKKVSTSVDDFRNVIQETVKEAENLHKNIIDWSAASMAIGSMTSAIDTLQSSMGNLTGYYEEQIVNEQKLAQSMRNTMDASDEQIQSIKDLCSAQQQLGVIGDEVQLAGAQEMATYLGETDSLKKLIPVMNDMIAQQYGLGASSESAAQIASMLGKVMNGQTEALSRYGYSFTEAQAAVLKFGTESERAAVLASVVSESVGGMNEALANTDAGKQQQAANAFGDMKERIGAMLEPSRSILGFLSDVGSGVGNITQLCTSTKAAGTALNGLLHVTEAWNKAVKASKVFMVALQFTMSSLPIGWIVAGIAAVAAGLVLAYQKIEPFRKACDWLYSSLKNVGKWIYDKLTPAFNKLSEVVSYIWGKLSALFGISESKTADTVMATGNAFDDASVSADKYMDMLKNTKKEAAKEIPVAGSIDAYQKAVDELTKKLNSASESERPGIVARLVVAEDELKKVQEQLNRQKFEARYTLKPLEMASKGSLLDGIKSPIDSLKDMKLDKIKLPALPTKDIYTMNDALADATSMFGSLGQAAGGAFGSVMNYLSGVLQTLPNLIAQLHTVFAAQVSTAAVSAAAGQAQQGPWGWLGVGAAIAATLAAVASIPKFANGAIAYGPTLGLFGEYAGASNNPEVVAPLDKLQSMISTDGGFGKVEFEIEGRVLKGILKKIDKIDSRG